MRTFLLADIFSGVDEDSREWQVWHNRNPNPDIAARAQEAINAFHAAVAASLDGCKKALNDYAIVAPSRSDFDTLPIWSSHCAVVEQFHQKLPRIHYCLSVVPLNQQWELLDSERKYQEAWANFHEANAIVGILNHTHVDEEYRTQPPKQVYLVECYRRLRHSRARIWHLTAIRIVRDDDTNTSNEAIHEHIDRWYEIKEELAARREEYVEQVIESLRPFFDDDHPMMAPIVEQEAFIEGLFSDLREGQFQVEDGEEAEEVVEWDEDELEQLKAELGPSRAIIIDAAQVRAAEPELVLEKQLLDNVCGACKKGYTTPCELNDCHHVFCFSCTVPWVDAREHCPTCRRKAATSELTLWDVTIKKATESNGSEGTDTDGKQEKLDGKEERGERNEEGDEREEDGDEVRQEDDEDAEFDAMLEELAKKAKDMDDFV